MDEVHEEVRFAEEYEASLMDRLDDAALLRVFSGLIERRWRFRCRWTGADNHSGKGEQIR
jgi:hypothetical protein